jgi:hypothetical protein
MSLIQNERTKLLAGALDRASTAFLTVGIVTPVAGYLYGLSRAELGLGFLAGAFAVWFLLAIGLHLLARYVLGGLQE